MGKLKGKLVVVLCIIVVIGVVIVLYYSGIIRINKLYAARYAIHGIDVSNHQQDIDWEQVAASEEVMFVFIKATEGKSYQDAYFEKNWDGASEQGLYVGAYHYFSTTSTGIEQANNYIEMVPKETGTLPPVIDIEEDGPEKDEFKKELTDFISTIEQYYGQKPILYVVYPLYNEYIKGAFEDCRIWIRDVVSPPSLDGDCGWLFWQYCDSGSIEGISTAVDLNVFSGSHSALKALLSDQRRRKVIMPGYAVLR